MAVPVVKVGVVDVGVDQGGMTMGVAMCAIHRFGMRVAVVFVVRMDMVVLDLVVAMLMFVPLGEVQP